MALIADVRHRFADVRGRRGAVALGIGDDCAVLRPGAGEEVLVTTDMLLEGRHFRRDTHSAESVGHRCLARGLSDIAAMGGRPVAAFLSLALPQATLAGDAGRAWVEGFLDGMRALAMRLSVPLAGGDTAEAPGDAVMADMVLVGSVPRGTALRRSGARSGDRLFCTGALGGAAAELRSLLRGDPAGEAEHPQLFPEPRLRIGELLRQKKVATAAIDVSDGLSTDLRHLCRASGVRAEVWDGALPVHRLAAELDDADRMQAVLSGGEDYELLFAAPGIGRIPRRLAGVVVTEIGRFLPVEAGMPTVMLVGEEGGRELEAQGWEHFVRGS